MGVFNFATITKRFTKSKVVNFFKTNKRELLIGPEGLEEQQKINKRRDVCLATESMEQVFLIR